MLRSTLRLQRLRESVSLVQSFRRCSNDDKYQNSFFHQDAFKTVGPSSYYETTLKLNKITIESNEITTESNEIATESGDQLTEFQTDSIKPATVESFDSQLEPIESAIESDEISPEFHSIKSTESSVPVSESSVPVSESLETRIESPKPSEETYSTLKATRPKCKPTTRVDDLIVCIRASDNLTSLFEIVRPKIKVLTSDHLEVIYGHINYLCFRLKNRFDRKECKLALSEFKQTIRTSATFQLLVNRTIELDNELSTWCLLNAFKTFSLINLKKENRPLRFIINSLNVQLSEFDYDVIPYFLKTLHLYSKNSSLPIKSYSNLSESLIRVCKQRALNNEIDTTNVEVLTHFFELFMIQGDLETADHLIKLLLSPTIELSFKQSTNLLSIIKINKQKRFKKTLSLKKSTPIDKLIEKCNASIFRHFSSSEPTFESVFFYCRKLHTNIDHLEDAFSSDLENLYDPEILKFIAPHAKYHTFNLVVNCSRFNIYDQRLLKSIYDLACNVDRFRSVSGIYAFGLLSKFRLPFVDYNYIAKTLFNHNSKQISKLFRYEKLDSMRFMCNLILSDVNDTRLAKFLNELKDHLFKRPSRELNLEKVYEQINLAKCYLSMVGETKCDRSIKDEFDDLFLRYSLAFQKPQADYQQYFNHKLLENAYLSNGLYLKTVAIYDRSIHDLISLDEYESYFLKMDQAPLNPDQEL